MSYLSRRNTLRECQSWGHRAKVESGCRLASTIQELLESRRRKYLLYFIYLYCYSITCLNTCHFPACFYVNTNIYVYIFRQRETVFITIAVATVIR